MNDRSAAHLKKCHPDLQTMGTRLLIESQPIVDKYFPGCTLEISDSQRDIYVQAGKWSQGRTWNKHSCTWVETSPGEIVTRTLHSKHLLTPCEAIDVGVYMDGKFSWPDPHFKANQDFWIELGNLGKKIGLRPGVFFLRPDCPHFELA